ncbi:MAG TPA: DUF4352 domain-containing protein [Micromonosporaceae bacterium]
MNLKKAALITAATVLGGLTLACGAGGTSNSGSGSTGASSSKAAAPKVAKLGQPARDGKFEFTVKTVKCGVHQVGPADFGQKAQGQFCLVTVQVKNIGKEAQMLDASNQKAFGADNAQYSADEGAALYANENDKTFLNQINPGNQVTGIVVFDIPANAKITKLELHDSPFSGGVDVQVG